jgi:phosphohistidine swiveling domain-containing protein
MIDDVVEFTFEGRRVRAREILNGVVACSGQLEEGEYLAGYAQKVEKNSDKIESPERIEQDSVLVTQMTDPSMMEEIRKSKAIVTEIGGLMSHAAIVSRELELLCIIGTKDAMKKINNGDRVYLKYETVMQGSFEDYRGFVFLEESVK